MTSGQLDLATAVAALRLSQPRLGIKPMTRLLREQETWQEVGMKEVRDAVAALDASAPAEASTPEPVEPALNLQPLPPCYGCRRPLLFDTNSGQINVPGLDTQQHVINECCGTLLCLPCCDLALEQRIALCPHCGQQSPMFTRTSVTVKRLQKLASEEHAECLFALAVRYRDGDGVPRDCKRAAEMLGRAIKLGHTDAALRLADMLLGCKRGQSGLALEKTGVPHNEARGLFLMRRAAEAGHGLAQYNMGFIVQHGMHCVEHDASEAARWWELAAAQGCAIAALELCVAYDSGKGVPKSCMRSFEYALKAAEQGDCNAEALVGSFYMSPQKDRYPPLDLHEAEKWLKRAAASQCIKSMLSLGNLYFESAVCLGERGVFDPDVDAAIFWYEEAVKHGHTRSKDWAELLRHISETVDKTLQEIGHLSQGEESQKPALLRCMYEKLVKNGDIPRWEAHRNRLVRCGQCNVLGIDAETRMKKCDGCKQVFYCNVDCQKVHWKAIHKHECKKMVAPSAEAATRPEKLGPTASYYY